MMELASIEKKIEAILFAAGSEVLVRDIAQAVGVDVQTARLVSLSLRDKYDYDERGIKIICLEDGFQMASRDMYYEDIGKILAPRRHQNLSNAAFEVLAIVAYNQPCTRAYVDFIRGVDSGGSMNKLIERELICEKGKSDAPGKPLLYGTTMEFLRVFSLSSLDDLPNRLELSIEEL